MRMKDVIISVTGIQHGRNGPDSMQLITAGQYGMDADEIRMTWIESELTGMEGTRTSITVQPNNVVVTREGEVSSTLEFDEGRKSYFLYETPFGSATMGLNTRRIRNGLGIHGGDMEIEYTLDVDQNIVGRNRFYVQRIEALGHARAAHPVRNLCLSDGVGDDAKLVSSLLQFMQGWDDVFMGLSPAVMIAP